jgi:hypothetical protein
MGRTATEKAPDSWQALYEKHARKHRALTAELRRTKEMLGQMDEAFGVLLRDDHFTTLLRAEGLDQIPAAILKRTRG